MEDSASPLREEIRKREAAVEHELKLRAQRGIDVPHWGCSAKSGKASHTVAADAAWHYAVVIAEIGRNIQRDSVIRHPTAHAHADGGDLVFAAVVANDPNADATLAALAANTETGERADQPFFEIADKASDIRSSAAQV